MKDAAKIRRAMRPSWKRWAMYCLIPALLSALPMTLLGNSEKDTKKQLEQEAKALIAEAKTLEQSGELLQARAKYAQAEALVETKDAAVGVRKVDKQIEIKVQTYLAMAGNSYLGARYAEGASFIEQGLALRPSDPTLLYNAALFYFRSGDSARVLAYLDRASASVYKRQSKAMFQQWYTIATTGESSVFFKDNDAKHLSEFNALVTKLSEAITPAEMRVVELSDSPPDQQESVPDNHPAGKLSVGESLGNSICAQTPMLERLLPSSPAALFDRANCAELEGHLPEASRLLQSYLESSPNAADAAETHERIDTLQALANLPEPQKSLMAKYYSAYVRSLYERKYDRALHALEQSEKTLPDFPPTQWHLALFYEAMGDTKSAAEHFTRYGELDTSEEARQRIAAHLPALEDWRKDYDNEISQAEEIITSLLQRGLGLTFAEEERHIRSRRARAKQEGQMKTFHKTAIRSGGFHVPYDFAREEFRAAAEHLQTALAIFPLGAEANQLMAIVSLQANDGRSAIAGLDAVAGHGLPVSFYAEVRGEHADRAAKCEIRPGEVRLIYLANLDKKGNARPAGAPAGDDALGNLTPDPSETDPADLGKTETRVIKLAEIQKLETKSSQVLLKLANTELQLSPIYLTDEPPYEGPPSRRFANTYTRLFIRYAGLEDAKLGTEGFTGWEKTKITYQMARSAYNIASSGGPMGGIQIAMEAYKISRLLHNTVAALRVQPTALRKRLVEEHSAFEAPSFKAIPLQPPPAIFRTELN